MKNKLYIVLLAATLMGGMSSCDDFLDREPLSDISPEIYFTDASQLESYVIRLYPDIITSHGNWSYGIFGNDNDTDNQAGASANNRFADGLWKVPNTEDSDWKFEQIYRCNFFLESVLAKYGENIDGSENTITGDLATIKHVIGEAYFLRACEYFKRYQLFGDFPIITKPLSDNKEELIEASKRMPRNEVARFILSDLDKAYTLLSAKNMETTRISADVAMLLKSRVALFEGTWLKYFKGTAFVPKGEGWPGAAKDYNANYEFPSGSIDNEINYFLDQAIEASQVVADKYKDRLTVNTGTLQQSLSDPANPYYDMFAQEDLSDVSEVLLWRRYARGLETHNVNVAASRGNYRIGLTRSFVNNFLMIDGTPVYRHGTYSDGDGFYMGDKTLTDVRTNRDPRLTIFLKDKGQKNILIENVEGESAQVIEPAPQIFRTESDYGYSTGYALRKGGSFDQKHYSNGGGYTAAVCYRAAEALLNYMEAYYERHQTLDATGENYWAVLRNRAGITGSIQSTINATDMNREAENDWGAYSKGSILEDKTLYNIRRERRCEFLAEGLRYMDLRRWRAMDQLMTKPYIVEGFHLWGTPMESWYEPDELIADGSSTATVSPKTNSEYLRPLQKNATQICYDGYTWHMAHYLSPVMIKQFLLTSSDGSSIETSPLYQNPYWPTVADQPAEQ